MIHVALFSFQRTTLSFEVRFRLKGFASSDSFIIPHLFRTVKNFFIFLFCLKGGRSALRKCFQSSVSNQGTLSCFRVGRYLAATCIILQELHPFVNSNLDFFSRFFQPCKTLPIDTKKASLARCSSSYGRGSWTRTNACGIQRPVPYQLGDTPVSSANRCQRKLLYRIPVVLASTFFLFLKIWYKKRHSPFTCVRLCYNIIGINL